MQYENEQLCSFPVGPSPAPYLIFTKVHYSVKVVIFYKATNLLKIISISTVNYSQKVMILREASNKLTKSSLFSHNYASHKFNNVS